MPAFVVSGSFVESIVRGIRKTPHFDEIVARVSPSAAAMLMDSWKAPWHPGELYVEVGAAAVQMLGEAAFENLSYSAVKDRFAPIVLPMVARKLAKPERTPDVVLHQLEDFVSVAMKGVSIDFRADGENGCSMHIEYPNAVGAHLLVSWRGVFRYVFEVTKPATVTAASQSVDQRCFDYQITW